jgi:hypothetical protein
MFEDDHTGFVAIQTEVYSLPPKGVRYDDVLGAGQAYKIGTSIGTKPGLSLMTAGRHISYTRA